MLRNTAVAHTVSHLLSGCPKRRCQLPPPQLLAPFAGINTSLDNAPDHRTHSDGDYRKKLPNTNREPKVFVLVKSRMTGGLKEKCKRGSGWHWVCSVHQIVGAWFDCNFEYQKKESGKVLGKMVGGVAGGDGGKRGTTLCDPAGLHKPT